MKILNSYIDLKRLRFYAYHGVSPQENCVGNEYTINLRLKTDITQAAQTDDVNDTVNYAEVYETIRQEMNTPSKLLEHLCARIVQALFTRFSAIEEIDIELSKRNPPMGADIESAGISMHCCRSNQ